MSKVKSGEGPIFFGLDLINPCTMYSWKLKSVTLKANFVAEESGWCSIVCLSAS